MRSVRWKALPAHIKPAGDQNQPGFDAVSSSWDTTAAKAKKPRAFKLTPPKEKERPGQRSITESLNKQIIDGGCFHIANEGLFSFIEDEKLRFKLWRAMLNDGVLPGAPDDVVIWREMPEQKFPYVGFLEIKRPGWTMSGDKKWREGKQPKAHDWLASFGAPTAIVRDIYEAQEAVLSWGVRLRYRLDSNAGGGQFIVPTPPT